MSKILLIDDDEELCELVSEYLTVEGFIVNACHNGEDGLKKALENEHELIILDVMLPKKNGFDLLRDLRGQSKIPVVMLTARGDDTDRIVGLEIGADDYLPKPFNPRELVARIRAILRRSTNGESYTNFAEKFQLDDLDISIAARSAKRENEALYLTGVEFDLLVSLLRNAGNIVKKEDLSMQVLDRRLSPFDRSLDMHVSNLRKKLGARANGDERIKTIRSVGYIYTMS